MRRLFTRAAGLYALSVPLVAVAFFVASEVSLAPEVFPPEAGSIDLEVGAPSWDSEPIRIDATMVGLSWTAGPPPTASVKVSEDGSTWGPWTELSTVEDHGEDGPPIKSTEGVYVGLARWVQVRVEGAQAGLNLDYVETAGRNLSLVQRIGHFVGRIRFAETQPAMAAGEQPAMVSRSEWGGDACVALNPEYQVEFVRRVELLFVHHTVHSATANAYAPEDSRSIVYALCVYAVTQQGWNDIAYNFLIDQYGVIYEGRGGGVYQGVLGAHTRGFNSTSTGVAFMGDHSSLAPSVAAQDAFVGLAAWKLDVHHIDPTSVVTVRSRGSDRYPDGSLAVLPAIAVHHDTGLTSCPGDAGILTVGALRQRIAATPGPKLYGGWPDQEPIQGLPDRGYQPATFNFRMTEPMTWNLSIVDGAGLELFRQQGSGDAGAVMWDGRFQGQNLPVGDYQVRIDAVPLSGALPPRSAEFVFQLGSFLPPFADDEGSVHEPDIAAIAGEGITAGCGPYLFCPLAELPRWQMALFLTRLHKAAGFTLPDGADQGFGDLSGLSPEAFTAINQLAQLGVTAGVGTAAFDPAGIVSRWQMALFLVRIAAIENVTIPEVADQGFTDLTGLPPQTAEAINQLAHLGVTAGTGPGTFDPNGVVTRQQMASFLIRTLGLGRGGVA